VQVLGADIWTVISNVTEPLAILFYFHSVGCLADIVRHAFTDKYIGLLSEQTTETTDVSVTDVPETIVLVRSSSSVLLRQLSKQAGVCGQRNSGMSRIPSVDSISSRSPQSPTNLPVIEETF
jgi:hypothetical protein